MKHYKSKRPQRAAQKGSIAIVTAIAAVAMIGAAGVALDVGRGYQTQSNMQDALDAGTRAAASSYFNLVTRAIDDFTLPPEQLASLDFNAFIQQATADGVMTYRANVKENANSPDPDIRFVDTCKVVGNATAQVDTTLSRVIGRDTMEPVAQSASIYDSLGLTVKLTHYEEGAPFVPSPSVNVGVCDARPPQCNQTSRGYAPVTLNDGCANFETARGCTIVGEPCPPPPEEGDPAAPTVATIQPEVVMEGDPLSLVWVDAPIHDQRTLHGLVLAQKAIVNFPIRPDMPVNHYVDWYASSITPLVVYNTEGGVQDGTQLFSNYTFGQEWEDGYAALASLDTKGIGSIEGQALEKLSLWFDHNQDGRVQDGEIMSLSKAGVIRLHYQQTQRHGNHIYALQGYDRLINGEVVTLPSFNWFSHEYERVEEQQHSALSTAIVGEQGNANLVGQNTTPSLAGIWFWADVPNAPNVGQFHSPSTPTGFLMFTQSGVNRFRGENWLYTNELPFMPSLADLPTMLDNRDGRFIEQQLPNGGVILQEQAVLFAHAIMRERSRDEEMFRLFVFDGRQTDIVAVSDVVFDKRRDSLTGTTKLYNADMTLRVANSEQNWTARRLTNAEMQQVAAQNAPAFSNAFTEDPFAGFSQQ